MPLDGSNYRDHRDDQPEPFVWGFRISVFIIVTAIWVAGMIKFLEANRTILGEKAQAAHTLREWR